MVNVFKELLRKERPSFVFSLSVVTYGQLNAVTCKFAKDNQFYRATSFFTEAWISSIPSGPPIGSTMTADCLNDIATITEYATLLQCKTSDSVSEADLKVYTETFQEMATHKFKGQFDPLVEGDEFTFNFSVAPAPTVTITVKNSGHLIGTLLALSNGDIHPVLICHPRLVDYISDNHGGERVPAIRRLSLDSGG